MQPIPPLAIETLQPLDIHQLKLSSDQTSLRLRLQIPKEYREVPILGTLVEQYRLTVNILAALMSGNTNAWFDIEIQGSSAKLSTALQHLQQLGVELWIEDNTVQTLDW